RDEGRRRIVTSTHSGRSATPAPGFGPDRKSPPPRGIRVQHAGGLGPPHYGRVSLASLSRWVNSKSNWLSNWQETLPQRLYRLLASATPGRDGKHSMLLAQVARRRRHDGALGNHQLPARLNCHPDVFFTDELERLLAGRVRL